jgi:two-component system, NtrC family, sensor kinase
VWTVPTLFVIRGADQGNRFELTESTIRLGRDPSNTLQLHDTEVSRHHAEIRVADNEYSISDLNSSNGTYVNGQRIRHQTLASGDQIQLGSTLMLYTGPAEETQEDLAKIVRIGAPAEPDDRSRIVRSLSQEEGSRIFDLRGDAPQNSWLARARSNLQVMYRTALAVSHTLDIDQLLQRIMELIFEWVEADHGCIMLMEPTTKTLQPKTWRTRKGVRGDDRITISKTILDYVIGRNEGVLTSDARQDERWDPAGSIVQMGVREAICVPMQGRYDVVGAIYIDTSTSARQLVQQGIVNRFTEDHLKLMIAIAHQAALAVEDTRYYSAMVQAERLAAIGQTIATLSHHIKNILQGIRGGSYLIEMGLKDHDDDVLRKGWKIVERNQNRISGLVMDMLTFSKEREPDLQVANLNEIVSDVVELMRVRAGEVQAELEWRPGEPMPDLVFDPEGIHRSVLNVVTNAIDAVTDLERPGHVTVATQYLPKQTLVRITVEDNGPGIPPDQVESIFSPFVSSKKSHGTGLGLPVSQKIFNEHGGRIAVESEPDQGSRFILELPATLPQPNPETASVTLSGENVQIPSEKE